MIYNFYTLIDKQLSVLSMSQKKLWKNFMKLVQTL